MSSDPTPEAPRGFPVALTVAVAAMFVFLCGLGTWQLQRLDWKRDLIARIAAREHAPPRPLAEVLAERRAGADVTYVRVRVTCLGLAKAPFVRLYALNRAKTGDRLMSACRPADGGATVLVDRGFLPDGGVAPGADPGDRTPVALVGVLRQPDPASAFTPPHAAGGRWFARDLAGMSRELGVPTPEPLYVAAETATNPEDPALQPAPLPLDISNRHLGYVVTWYGLAAALLAVYGGLLLSRRKGRKPA